MWRLIGILVTIVLAIVAAVLTWPQFFHLERTYPIAQLVSFRGAVVVAFGALLVLALLLALIRPLRGFAASIAIVALLGGVANVAIVWMRGTGTHSLPAATDTSIRVMSWNTAGESTDPALIAKTAVAMDADIVTLPETTAKAGTDVAVAMRKLGHRMWVLSANYQGWDASYTTILISPRLGNYSVIQSSLDGSSNTSSVPSAVAMPVDGSGPIIVAAHAVAPRPHDMEHWRSDLRWLADQCADDDVIMAGDFNATIDHMAGLGEDGGTLGRCTDAAAATGNGSVGTWSTTMPTLVGAPIDHVMTSSSWKATGSVVIGSMDGSGSDHRPIVVQLEPAER